MKHVVRCHPEPPRGEGTASALRLYKENPETKMRTANSKQAWYTFFFGVRGLLRLFIAMLAFSYTIFVCKFVGSDGGSPFSRLTNAITIAAGRWEIILLFTGLFSIALWFGFHSDVEPRGWGLYRMFSEECEDYDWWGRRIEGKRRQ